MSAFLAVGSLDSKVLQTTALLDTLLNWKTNYESRATSSLPVFWGQFGVI
jgi:hypothetical protein